MRLRNLLTVQVLLLILSVACALILGFFAFDSQRAVELIKNGGYWLMLLNVVWLLVNLWRRSSKYYGELGQLFRVWGEAIVFIIFTWLVLLAIQPTSFKITMDEPVLAATALRMHEYKEVMTTVRAHEIQGVFTQLDGYVDKRPYFYPFVLSLLHDFTGYRSSNTFLLNALLTPVFLGCLFICGHWCWPRYGGYASVSLFSTVPLLAMNVNGGGFELLNLCMLLAAAIAARSYLREPSSRRLDTLILLGLLLAQTRYESVLYVFAVALVGIIGWAQVRRILISPATLAAPLLLVPFAWLQVIFSEYQGLWQLKADKPFLFRLVPDNLEHAASFFFNFNDDQQPNSFLLSVCFVAALVVVLVCGLRWLKNCDIRSSQFLAFLPFGMVVVANFFLLMAYHWGQLDDIIATRIVLPFILLQVLLVVFVLGRLPHSRALHTVGIVIVAGYLMGATLPLCARSDFLRWVPARQEALWLQEKVQESGDASVLFVSNKHLLALVERKPAISLIQAMSHKEELNLHLRLGSYQEILFIYPQSTAKDSEGASDDIAANFELELIQREMMSEGHYMCMSRLIAVKWRDAETRTLELPKLPTADDSEARLQFYARTLP